MKFLGSGALLDAVNKTGDREPTPNDYLSGILGLWPGLTQNHFWTKKYSFRVLSLNWEICHLFSPCVHLSEEEVICEMKMVSDLPGFFELTRITGYNY